VSAQQLDIPINQDEGRIHRRLSDLVALGMGAEESNCQPFEIPPYCRRVPMDW
jgi:hypothetical protein